MLNITLGLVLIQFLSKNIWDPQVIDDTDAEVVSVISVMPTKTVWRWVPNMYWLRRLSRNTDVSSVEGDRPESAEHYGRVCSICLLPKEEELPCPMCSHIQERLTQVQSGPDHGSSLMRVIESLKLWSQEMPTWDVLHWLQSRKGHYCARFGGGH